MNSIAKPENPFPLAGGDIYEACRDFVLTYALPLLLPSNVVQGWQNRLVLPPGAGDYAVISILHDKQHGATIEEFQAANSDPNAPGLLIIKGLVEVAVQVDFCAEDDTARQRARRLAIVTRSSIGARFFKDYGMSALFADDVRDISSESDAEQLIRRWTTTLHLTLTEGISVEVPYFNQARVGHLENVGVHHPNIK